MKKYIIEPLSKTNIRAADTEEQPIIISSNNRSLISFKWVNNKDNPKASLEATLTYLVDKKIMLKRLQKEILNKANILL